MTSTVIKDSDIRKELHRTAVRKLCISEPATRVVDELGIMEGAYRIDVAVVNGLLHGFEIKSGADNLDRLPSQQASFNKIFDKMTLVADERHVEEAMRIVPSWWGLIAASGYGGRTVLQEIWPARLNHSVDPYLLAQLLWRDEAWTVLRDRGIGRGLSGAPRKVLWRTLAEKVPLEQLREAVRLTIITRTDWR